MSEFHALEVAWRMYRKLVERADVLNLEKLSEMSLGIMKFAVMWFAFSSCVRWSRFGF